MRNVRDRLRLIYGSAAELRIESRLGEGTAVTVLLPLAFVWAVVRHLCALPMVLRRRTAGAALPWLLLFGLLAMAALRCGMIAFVEVSSFGIGTSTMYLSTVHPLLLLYTYGCLICYRNKGVITE